VSQLKELKRTDILIDFSSKVFIKSRPDYLQAFLINYLTTHIAVKFLNLNYNDEEYDRILDFATNGIVSQFKDQDIQEFKIFRQLSTFRRGSSRFLYDFGSVDNDFFTAEYELFIISLSFILENIKDTKIKELLRKSKIFIIKE